MSLLKVNLQLGKDAIQYLKKLGITSVNVPFRITSYMLSPLGRFDAFLLFYMRSETKMENLDHHTYSYAASQIKRGKSITKSAAETYVKERIAHGKDVRGQILEILRSNDTKHQKKARLKALMNEVGFKLGEHDLFPYKEVTGFRDEARIRSARKAIKFMHGNCGEKSAIVATWLVEKVKNGKAIYWVNAENWDHAWVVMGERGKIDPLTVRTRPISTWDEDTVIVDGWTGDYYPARHPYNLLKGINNPNPFQLFVRKRIQGSSTRIKVMEVVKWPPKFSPNFTLAKAADPNSSYEPRRVRSDTESILEEVADDYMELVQEMRDMLERQ